MRGRRKYEKMNIINVENITKSYTGRKLFSKASFYVQENEKIGIIGINGTGKSTLLKIVAGDEEPDEGTVTTANHIVINYLPQNPEFDPDETALEHVMGRVVTSQLDEDMRWSIESDAKSLLMKLDITDMAQKTGELSGGQRKRLALATVVLKPCDVLILDEPTNHLDYEMVEWLEDYLRRFRGAIIMITHDRYFLDSVCNRIVEVDKGQTYSYDTNYSGFLELKAAREESERASERKRQSILRKEIEWMQRGARARSTKQKAHIQRYEALRDQKGPQTDGKVELSSVSSRMGRTTIELHDISKAYGDIVCVKDFTYIFLKNDRIGIIGPNGCGKSTLLKMIYGNVEPDAGTIEIGQTIRMGYFSQENEEMDGKMRVIDYVKEVGEYIQTSDGRITASQMLENFLFDGAMQWSPIEKLSGGERRRLFLLRVLMSSPNVLILDEPTNDLDIQTLTILEDYLDRFDGIIIIVSHDRYFLDRTVNRIFSFEGNGVIRQFEGGYSDYLIRKELESPESGNVSASLKAQNASSGKDHSESDENENNSANLQDAWKRREKKLKFSFKEQREFDTIDEEIEVLEQKIADLDSEMMKSATNSVKLGELMVKKDETEKALEEKMDRWVYLNDLNERILNGE